MSEGNSKRETLERRLIAGLESTAYVYAPEHKFLASDAGIPVGANIGRRGEDLTIAFLSMDRSALSCRLLDSIERELPDFGGRVLIIDQGSQPAELQKLKARIGTLRVPCEMVELGQNLGVAGGRNRAMSHVKTHWVLSLDNDIYFKGNPLTEIQQALALLGCHFLNLPLLERDGDRWFALGGHLYVTIVGSAVHVGGGSACRQEVTDGEIQSPFLSTFLFGGACVLRVASFLELGAYDEAMFVGFEDVDFSIRLFQAGRKVGNIGAACLIHDHPPPDNDAARNYERERFSRSVLRRSAEHIEKKHGFRVWSDGEDRWLSDRHKDLGIFEPSSAASRAESEPKSLARPRIALITDTEDWAFGNIARQLVTHLSDQFDFKVVPLDVVESLPRLLLMTKDCQLVHFFWRGHLLQVLSDDFAERSRALGIGNRGIGSRLLARERITTAVYDHLWLDPADLESWRLLFRRHVAAYSVSSQRLRGIYSGLPGFSVPAAVLEDGVDLGLFAPQSLERFQQLANRKIRVGWCGNSKWATERNDSKGVHTILKPALKDLEAEGVPIQAVFADRADGFIPQRQMPSYYAGIDLYVCTSEIEGTPNPILEAMACGVPIISTDVGLVADAFGPSQRQWILRERSLACLKETLRTLLSNPHIFAELSKENLEYIRGWDWKLKVRAFASFFDGVLSAQRRAALDGSSVESILLEPSVQSYSAGQPVNIPLRSRVVSRFNSALKEIPYLHAALKSVMMPKGR